MLAVGTQPYALLELVHGVDMLHPVIINVSEKIYSFKLSHGLLGNELLVFLVFLRSLLGEHFTEVILLKLLKLLL